MWKCGFLSRIQERNLKPGKERKWSDFIEAHIEAHIETKQKQFKKVIDFLFRISILPCNLS